MDLLKWMEMSVRISLREWRYCDKMLKEKKRMWYCGSIAIAYCENVCLQV